MAGETAKARSRWIDTARAVGILFILFAHAGVFIPYISVYAPAFYVPVFFVLSGYLHRDGGGNFGSFARRRAERLLVPYFGFNAFLYGFYVLKCLLQNSLTAAADLWLLFGIFYSRAYIRAPLMTESVIRPLMYIGNSPMWFLTALFTAELLFRLLLRASGKDMKKLFFFTALCFGGGVLLHYFCPVLLPWSADTALLFQVYLTAGYAVGRYGLMEKGKAHPWGVFLLFLLSAFGMYENGPVNLSLGNFGVSTAAGVAVTLAASFVLMQLCFCIFGQDGGGVCGRILSALGRSTLPVMCMHLFVFMFIQAGAVLLFPGLYESPAGKTAADAAGALAAAGMITAVNMVWERLKGK